MSDRHVSDWEIHVQLLLPEPAAGDAERLTAALVEAYRQGADTGPEFVAEAHHAPPTAPGALGAASLGGTLQITGAATPGEAVDRAVTLLRSYFRTAGISCRGLAEVTVTPAGVDPRTLP